MQVLGVPAQVFARQDTVAYSHVLRVPESVLRVYHGVGDVDVPAVLERVIAVLTVIAYSDVVAVHEDIIGMRNLHSVDIDVAAVPQSFLRVGDVHAAKLYAVHLAEHLGSHNLGVAHFETVRIPQSCACALSERAALYLESIDMPEQVFALESTMLRIDVGAAFKRRLTGMYRHVYKLYILFSEKRSFATEFCVFYKFHSHEGLSMQRYQKSGYTEIPVFMYL